MELAIALSVTAVVSTSWFIWWRRHKKKRTKEAEGHAWVSSISSFRKRVELNKKR